MTTKTVAPEVSHTPTPWFYTYDDTGSVYRIRNEEDGRITASLGNKENAAFIVRAVNAHDELVSLLWEVLDYGKTEQGWKTYEACVRKALTKVEGK